MCACFGLFSRALPEAEKAREKRRSGRNSAAQHSRISGTARGGDAEDAGCSNHLTPTKSKDRLSGRSFAVLSNVRLLWAFFSSAAGGREFFTLRFPISSSQVRAWMKRAPFSLNVFTADGVSDPIS